MNRTPLGSLSTRTTNKILIKHPASLFALHSCRRRSSVRPSLRRLLELACSKRQMNAMDLRSLPIMTRFVVIQERLHEWKETESHRCFPVYCCRDDLKLVIVRRIAFTKCNESRRCVQSLPYYSAPKWNFCALKPDSVCKSKRQRCKRL